MKIILGIAIVCFTSYCGCFMAKKYRIRKRFFLQFYEFNERFINEITYYRRPIGEFIKNATYKGEFKSLIEVFFARLSVDSTKNVGVAPFLKEYDFLKADERSFLEDYFSMLGKGDSFSQKEYFSGARKTLSEWKAQSEKDCASRENLYLKLGFLLGLAILILIV